jgi:hypothetical protein
LAALQLLGERSVVACDQCFFEAVKFGLIVLERTQDFGAVLLEDRAPELRVAAGDARRVTEAAAREVAPGGIALREKRAERGSEDLRQMADVRDDFVVAGGCDCRAGGAEIAPEFQDGRSGGRCSLGLMDWLSLQLT